MQTLADWDNFSIYRKILNNNRQFEKGVKFLFRNKGQTV